MNKILLIAVVGATAVASAGEIVKASSFGWNPTNATKCLQAAFDSGASKVIVDKQASEWLVDMVFPRSNTEIVFADGVVVRARPGSMVRNIDNLFRCRGVSNLVMRGEGRAVLRMNRKDYLDKTRYRHGEHRHAISLHNAENVVVRDLTVEDSGGDGVYVLNVTHALLENLVCSGHARQGTSVISADDVTIRNCVFKHTKGALPECGMDIEPGDARFNVCRVQIENCLFCSNNCSGVAINVSGLKSTNKAMDVVYRNCRMFDNALRGTWLVLARGTWAPVKGNLRFENCVFAGNGGGPLQVNNLGSDALHVAFKDCTFDAAGIRPGKGAPISLVNGTLRDDLANLSFDGCRLLNCPAGRAVSFDAMTGAGQSIYFQAKAGTGDVKVELTMSPGEWVSAELIAPSGNVVDRCERRDVGVILVGTRAKDAPAGIWSLHVTQFADDCHLRLGAATSGVYAYDKELLLVEK